MDGRKQNSFQRIVLTFATFFLAWAILALVVRFACYFIANDMEIGQRIANSMRAVVMLWAAVLTYWDWRRNR